jgi:hypothetical protein
MKAGLSQGSWGEQGARIRPFRGYPSAARPVASERISCRMSASTPKGAGLPPSCGKPCPSQTAPKRGRAGSPEARPVFSR